MLIKIVVCFISLFIPVRKGLFIFGSWSAERYGDNSRYFFEYLSIEKNEYDVHWFTKNTNVANNLRGKGFKCIYGINLKSIWLHIRAEAVFCNCHQNSDVLGHFINTKTKVFNLWHGSPIKLIGADAINSGIGDLCIDNAGGLKRIIVKKIKAMFSKLGLKSVIYYLASSDSVASCLKSAFNLNNDNIIVAPYPKLKANSFNKDDYNVKKMLFAPTYRGKYNSENDILTAYGFEVDQVDSWLAAEDSQLYIRLHPANTLPQSIVDRITDSENIFIDHTDDLYEEFHKYDVVITDFSSVYFDAVATEKLVIMCPMGLSSYLSNDRNLYYSPEYLFPFPLSYSWDELIKNYSIYKALTVSEFGKLKEEFYPYDSCIEPSGHLLQVIECILRD
ncbi:CDP-glycerol glycerophosphotransferase family protein [Aeromonas allosaccharophila]|uniref:CDP-glycerol glycerophosphotransferase family protein n=1 Tax=Aeromonas allosaccharophila TaxID=656 RepID=UPI0030076EDD